jgi:hypothetical protein
MLDDVERLYPAWHYIMVDDKLHILTAMKKAWGNRLTTVWPRQGHYALDPKIITVHPPPDLSVERISDLVDYDLPAFLRASKPTMHDRKNMEPGRLVKKA